jgi:hypothetical protein
MRNSFAIGPLFGLLGTAQPAKAQEASEFELDGGFSYVRFNVNANLPGVAPRQLTTHTAEVASLSTMPTIGWVPS